MAQQWSHYYDKQRQSKVKARPTLRQALALFGPHPRTALDLGCGMGQDTLELLEQGWQVTAVDSSAQALELLQTLVPAPAADRLRVQQLAFEQIQAADFAPAALVNASFSLPFCRPESFNGFWEQVRQLVAPGGRFCGHFFGPRDEWYGNPKLTFHSLAQTRELLRGFTIEALTEEEGQMPVAAGGQKHWHILSAVAQKNA